MLRFLSHVANIGTQTAVASDRASADDQSVVPTGLDTSTATDQSVATGEEIRNRGGDTNSGSGIDEGKTSDRDCDNHTPQAIAAITAIAGSCLSYIAQEIDIPSDPHGAMASVLSLLLPSAGSAVRAQAALTLGAIAGQGYYAVGTSRASISIDGEEIRTRDEEEEVGRRRRETVVGDDVQKRRARKDGRRLVLWTKFCATVIGGTGAQVRRCRRQWWTR